MFGNENIGLYRDDISLAIIENKSARLNNLHVVNFLDVTYLCN